MKILSIETSCDETAVAILKITKQKEYFFKILSNIVASQIKIHQKYGGVYPTLAKREHERNLAPVLRQSLSKARLQKSKVKSQKSKIQIKSQKLKTLKEILQRHQNLYKSLKRFLSKSQKPTIDLIAVTVGPGLEPCLWTGVNFAKALSFWWNLPIVPVNHIEAHILVNFIEQNQIKIKTQKLFPAVCLVVSGGHTQLILMRNFGKYEIVGETRDDAAGECFDKTARILGLPYPGGPAIEKQALQWKSETQRSKFKIKLPRPMIYSKDYDFSFSGLKTAVLYKVKNQKSKIKNQKFISQMAYEIQAAINDVLVKKTIKAVKDFRAKSIILGGGVAANSDLRKRFENFSEVFKINFLVPPKKYCTDNAVMIAVAAFFHKKDKMSWQKIKANANLRIS